MSRATRHYANRLVMPPLAWASISPSMRAYGEELAAAAETIREGVRGGEIYTGYGGIALLTARHGELSGDCTLLDAAAKLAGRCSKALAADTDAPTFIMGRPGALALQAVLAHRAGDASTCAAACELVRSYAARVLPLAPAAKRSGGLTGGGRPLPYELLYGRAGYLWTCLYLRGHLGAGVSGISDAFLHPIVETIIGAGVEGAAAAYSHGHAGGRAAAAAGGPSLSSSSAVASSSPPPLMYWWHETPYLGAAHGLVGILHTLVLTPTLTPDDRKRVVGTLDYLLACRFPSATPDHHDHDDDHDAGGGASSSSSSGGGDGGSAPGGNLPSHAPDPGTGDAGSDRLVHWCHGAPGLAMALASAYQVLGDARYLVACREACGVVWTRGLLRKASLCHGIAGNAYAFLALARAERAGVARGDSAASAAGAEAALTRARLFALFMWCGHVDDATGEATIVMPPALAAAHGGGCASTATASSGSGSVSATTGAPGSRGSDASGGGAPSDIACWERLVATGNMHGGDHWWSLFEGAAGVAYMLMEVAAADGGDGAAFPCFELPPAAMRRLVGGTGTGTGTGAAATAAGTSTSGSGGGSAAAAGASSGAPTAAVPLGHS